MPQVLEIEQFVGIGVVNALLVLDVIVNLLRRSMHRMSFPDELVIFIRHLHNACYDSTMKCSP